MACNRKRGLSRRSSIGRRIFQNGLSGRHSCCGYLGFPRVRHNARAQKARLARKENEWNWVNPYIRFEGDRWQIVRGPIWGIRSLTLIISCSIGGENRVILTVYRVRKSPSSVSFVPYYCNWPVYKFLFFFLFQKEQNAQRKIEGYSNSFRGRKPKAPNLLPNW